jgi:hypothetical protein
MRPRRVRSAWARPQLRASSADGRRGAQVEGVLSAVFTDHADDGETAGSRELDGESADAAPRGRRGATAPVTTAKSAGLTGVLRRYQRGTALAEPKTASAAADQLIFLCGATESTAALALRPFPIR